MNPNRKPSGTITVHANVDRTIVDLFNRMYPRCLTRFIRSCMSTAVNDKVFFDKMFFPDVSSLHDSLVNNV